jgi:hypothetical protein
MGNGPRSVITIQVNGDFRRDRHSLFNVKDTHSLALNLLDVEFG